MFKYVNAFTNRSGDSLPGYFARLFDSDGNAVDIFADDNGTPISTVSGVANAALSDENGMFRWYVANGTYDMRFYDSNDTFVSVETGVPMIDASGVYTDLSGEEGATLVGTPTGTVQDDIDARPTAAVLAAPTGGEMVGFQQNGANAIETDILVKARQAVADQDFSTGLVGALAAVRDLGTVAFSGAVQIPNGTTQISAAVPLQATFNRVAGTGGGTYWQTNAAASVFSGAGAEFTLSRFEGFRTYAGVNVFDITTSGEIATLSFRRIDISNFTGNAFNFAGGLTSSLFSGVYVDGGTGADYGIYSDGGINNDNVVENCDFTNLTKSAVRLKNLSQGFWFNYNRVENGGINGETVFEFEGASGVRINGGWFEAHHEYLLKLNSASTDGTVIDGIVDIGAHVSAGVFKASLFDVGTKLIVFGTNVWNNRTTAPLNCLIYGLNDKLSLGSSNVWEHKSERGGKVHAKGRNSVVAGAVFDAFTFTRPASTPNATSNLQCISGILTLSYVGLNTGGSIARRSEQWPIAIEGVGSVFDIEVGTAFAAITANAGGVTVVPSLKAGGTATALTLQVTVAGAHASETNLVSATFEFTANTNLATNPITVAAA